MAERDLVTIANYGNLQEASLLKAILEEQGVSCYLVGSQASDTLNIVGTAVGGVQLQVEVHDEDKARRLLDELEVAPTTEAWQCPQCGSQVDAGFEICWSCGLTLDQAAMEIGVSRSEAESPPHLDEDEEKRHAEPSEGPLTPEAVEDMASRAFRSAVLGVGMFPLLFYALYLLVKLSNQELSDKALKRYYAATGIILFMLAAFISFFAW